MTLIILNSLGYNKDKFESLKINIKVRKIITIIIAGIFFHPIVSSSELIDKISKEENNKKSISLDKTYLKTKTEDYYILDSGDSIRIIISRDYPELTSNVVINGEGLIYLPLLKSVFVKGLTIKELNGLLNEAYKEFVKYPEVNSYVVSYRPIKVFIKGEVNSPGRYTLKGSQTPNFINNNIFNQSSGSPLDFKNSSTQTKNYIDNLSSDNPLFNPNEVSFYFPTVFDALRTSGGITQYSDLSQIVVIRKNSLSNGGGKIMTSLNFNNVLLDGDSSNNIRIYDGDLIEVKRLTNPNPKLIGFAMQTNLNPKFVRVFVSGRVNNPGLQTLSKSSSLNDAIDVAGGTKVIRGPIRYISFNSDGSIEKRKISFRRRNKRGSVQNPILKDGDLIIIGNSILSNATEFLSEITSPFVGLYSTYNFFDTIFDD